MDENKKANELIDIASLLDRYRIAEKPTKEIKTLSFQVLALDAIGKLRDGSKFKGQIFKAFKMNPNFAKIALSDSCELGKPFSLYFFKVYHALVKNAKNIKIEIKQEDKNELF